jgi:hypothetical protein
MSGRIQTDSTLIATHQEARACLITWALVPVVIVAVIVAGRVAGPAAGLVALVAGFAVAQLVTNGWYQSIKRREGPNAHRMAPWKTIPAALRVLQES